MLCVYAELVKGNASPIFGTAVNQLLASTRRGQACTLGYSDYDVFSESDRGSK